MHQKLGRWFRARYDRLLSRHWNYTEIDVFSTSVDRTLNSAQANLQGLYETMGEEWKFDPKMSWSPVPVKTTPCEYDTVRLVDGVLVCKLSVFPSLNGDSTIIRNISTVILLILPRNNVVSFFSNHDVDKSLTVHPIETEIIVLSDSVNLGFI